MKILIVLPASFERPQNDMRPLNDIAENIISLLPDEDTASVINLDDWIAEINHKEDAVALFIRLLQKSVHYDIIHTFSGIPLMMRAIVQPLIVFTPGFIDEWIPFPTDDVAGSLLIPQEYIPNKVVEKYRYALLNRRRSDERPWGYWESLYLGHAFKVKHIYAAPGELLSLQRHKHRTEVWTVVDGSGTVTLGDKEIAVKPGDSVTIATGEIHRAAGGPKGLHIIEIQFGDYLGEDDIERLEDKYGRKS